MNLWTSIGDLAKGAFSKYVFKDVGNSSANPVSSPAATQTGSTQPAVALNVAPVGTVAAVATAVADVAQLADDRLRINNTPEMVLALRLNREQLKRDEINRAIANRDIEKIRELGS